MLLIGSILFFLILFSTRIPVYDGERLFLHVFPAWALLIGLGFGWLWRRITSATIRPADPRRASSPPRSYGLMATYPFGLSYYNLLVGGLPGADRLGLEVTYWSDTVDDVLLDRLAREAPSDATAALMPTLYPGQGAMTTGFNRNLWHRGIVLEDDAAATTAEWVVVSYRTAYWSPGWRERRQRGGTAGRDPHRGRASSSLGALALPAREPATEPRRSGTE